MLNGPGLGTKLLDKPHKTQDRYTGFKTSKTRNGLEYLIMLVADVVLCSVLPTQPNGKVPESKV